MMWTTGARSFAQPLRLLVLAALLASLSLALRPAPVAAANAPFVVAYMQDVRDGVPGDGACNAEGVYLGCTLRAAIMEANAWPGDDVITLPAGTYNLTLAGAGENESKTGDLDITTNLTINGAGAGKTFVDGQQLDRVFHIASPGAKVTLSHLTVRNGKSGNHSGGGIHNSQGVLTLDQVVVSGNTSDITGGGIANDFGSATLLGSAVSGNTSGQSGGGINNTGDSNLMLTNSTVSGNTSEASGGGVNSFDSNLTMTNSTVSGNASGYSGGGIHLVHGAANLNNVTVAGNKADSDKGGSGGGGGVSRALGGQFYLKNTLIAANVDTGGEGPDCEGEVVSQGYNLIENPGSTCTIKGDTTGNRIGEDPRLAPLAFNGGPTRTHRLSYNSPALDKGGSGCAATDQPGVARPLDATADGSARCDIGAYEYTGPWITSLSPKARKAGSSGFTLIVTGVRFTANSVVRWNGVDHTPAAWSPTKLTVKITAGEIKKPGKVQVQVFTPEKGGGHSNPRIFTITAP